MTLVRILLRSIAEQFMDAITDAVGRAPIIKYSDEGQVIFNFTPNLTAAEKSNLLAAYNNLPDIVRKLYDFKIT